MNTVDTNPIDLEIAEFFSMRQQEADFEKFDAIMNRKGGLAPIEGDVIGGD